jgi:GMP synthase (glutamine-hydrolysing)
VDPNRILIIDYGSQFTQLIARRIREERVYCEIQPPTRSIDWIREWEPKGIILSGGPSSVYGADVPTADRELLRLGVPVFGICYGMQLITHLEGGVVERGKREYGRAHITIREPEGIFDGFEAGGADAGLDEPRRPRGGAAARLRMLASTPTCRTPPSADDRRDLRRAVPPRGRALRSRRGRHLELRLRGLRVRADLDGRVVHRDRDRADPGEVGDAQVICGLSGGVDSSVAATLVHRAIGDQLTNIFVDTGLLRKGERESVERTFRQHMGMKLEVVDASDLFLERLDGVEDPERKRKIIGHTFIDVFEDAAERLGGTRSSSCRGRSTRT